MSQGYNKPVQPCINNLYICIQPLLSEMKVTKFDRESYVMQRMSCFSYRLSNTNLCVDLHLLIIVICVYILINTCTWLICFTCYCINSFPWSLLTTGVLCMKVLLPNFGWEIFDNVISTPEQFVISGIGPICPTGSGSVELNK